MLWTPPEPRTLEQMHRYETRYEILITVNGETERAGFTNRVNQHTLLNFARMYRDYILPLISDADPMQYSRQHGLTFGDKIRIHKSGRTERDCRTLDTETARQPQPQTQGTLL